MAYKAPAAARVWLGAPNSIKGPTEAVFHRQSGNHLLIVGQREEAALALLGVGLAGLAAQFPRGSAQFTVLDSTPPETPKADDTPTSPSNTTTGDEKSKLILTVFPRGATATQIVDALNELLPQHGEPNVRE